LAQLTSVEEEIKLRKLMFACKEGGSRQEELQQLQNIVEDTQDHTTVNPPTHTAHNQAGQDACTAFSNFVSFMDEPDRIHQNHTNDYPKHKEICQKALRAATSATADRSVTGLRRPTIGVDVQLENRRGSDRSVS
jgi:hypothetical protein